MSDEFSARYSDLLTGSYDCVDRVVLNAYFSLAHSPGGFRTWWRRWHDDSDDQLDNARLMRMAGRFSRRVRKWAQVSGVPVIDCKAGERKHLIADEHLRDHPDIGPGVFMILVARAPATTWDVQRSRNGTIRNLAKKKTYVNHYSFHVVDPLWGHVTIKMSGHPPFGAQVILNGHEHVAAMARSAGVAFGKEGNPYRSFDDIRLLPKPAGEIPIWVGGGSEPAYRRAITRGDGFQMIGVTPEQAGPLVSRLRADRPEAEFTISLRTGWDALGMDRARIADERVAFAEAGIQHVVAAPWRSDIDSWERSMEALGSLVLAPD